jgi:hypothetical protein
MHWIDAVVRIEILDRFEDRDLDTEYVATSSWRKCQSVFRRAG